MKKSNLPAILGGEPVFKEAYHFVRPVFPPIPELLNGLEGLYESRYLTNQGNNVRALEENIASFLGIRQCALFCNATIALMSLIHAMELEGEIIVPSFTFAATTQALLWGKNQIKFVDINRKSLTIDPDKLENNISEKTSAILPVNIFGKCCEHDELRKFAQKHNLALVYDSAQAFGTIYKGTAVGTLGDAEVFSFHATKLFHTGEGGAVVTNNSDLYERLCVIRNFGFSSYLNCIDLGLNGKMSEFSALIGLKLLDSIPSRISNLKRIYQKYKEGLKDIPGITCPEDNLDCIPNYSYFYVTIDPGKFGMTNLELNYALVLDLIVTRCYFYPPVHRTSYYQKLFSNNPFDLPETDWASLHVLCLPVHSEMLDDDLAKIIEAIWRCHVNSKSIKKVLTDKTPENWEAFLAQPTRDPYDKYILSKERA